MVSPASLQEPVCSYPCSATSRRLLAQTTFKIDSVACDDLVLYLRLSPLTLLHWPRGTKSCLTGGARSSRSCFSAIPFLLLSC